MLAINHASPEDHRRWSAMLGLKYPILADQRFITARAYGCKVPLLPIVQRTVYALDAQGRVVFAERGHADLNRVLETIKRVRQ